MMKIYGITPSNMPLIRNQGNQTILLYSQSTLFIHVTISDNDLYSIYQLPNYNTVILCTSFN
jgi:hypothetical protein